MARILHVEDDLLDWQEIIKEDFVEAGHEVTSAASYDAAVQILESSPPFNLIISDGDYPDGGAPALLEYLHAKEITTPIIILTGGQQEMERKTSNSSLKPVKIFGKGSYDPAAILPYIPQ
jgi:CheY-like chemotaxis protein